MPLKFFLAYFLTMLCATAEERILNYHSDIRVGRDGYLDVIETIRVNVEGNEIRRGIYRDFPQEYKTKWGLRQHRPFEVTGVTRNGSAEPYAVEKVGSGTRVRIGSAEVLLETGSVQEYAIAYRTGRQLFFDDKGDELYWNVTGNFWNFPIMEATVQVILPEGIELREAEAYTGSKGDQGRAYEKMDTPGGVLFRTTAPLGRQEGLTIVVRWEPGMLEAVAYEDPSIWEGNRLLFFGLGLVVLGLVAFAVQWFRVGRDPARGVIIPGWEPPEGFSPAAVRYLQNMSFDDKCFTAAVLSLAAKGYLKVEEAGVDEYKLVKKDGNGATTADESLLYDALFSVGISLLLNQVNYEQIGGAKAVLKSALWSNVQGKFFHNHTGKWFVGVLLCLGGLGLMSVQMDDPLVVFGMMVFTILLGFWIGAIAGSIRTGRSSKWIGILVIPLLVVVLIFLGLIGNSAGVWCALATLVVLVAAPIFHFLMKAPTLAGRKALDGIAGFREYLSVAEEDRLNLENPPERTPELFERFLPYALALGVEQKWSEAFDSILTAAGKERGEQNYTPSFYSGGSSGFQNALTGAGIGAAIGGALASSSIAPSESGSSSGGFSGGGGGSSGGGGGGGGGGGW